MILYGLFILFLYFCCSALGDFLYYVGFYALKVWGSTLLFISQVVRDKSTLYFCVNFTVIHVFYTKSGQLRFSKVYIKSIGLFLPFLNNVISWFINIGHLIYLVLYFFYSIIPYILVCLGLFHSSWCYCKWNFLHKWISVLIVAKV